MATKKTSTNGNGHPKLDKPMHVQTPLGRKRTFETPEDLLEVAKEYFQWCADNPLYQQKSQWDAKSGQWQVIAEPRLRATTQTGFCLFAGIDTETFRRYATGENCFGDLKEAAQAIQTMIYNQKFEGASADMLNANIISRELGLADKKEVKADVHLDDTPIFE